MSWKEYVDQSLLGSQNLDRAAIFSADGDAVWATSTGFKVEPQELKEIVSAYKDKGDANGVKLVQKNGLFVAGDRYIVLKADDRSLYGKQGKEGIVIVKTVRAILIAHYPDTVQPGTATNTVEQLGDYLLSVGY